jgi:RNA polymerase sigma factor (sigma-70 family)
MKSPDPVNLSKYYESGAAEDFEAFVLDAEPWIFKQARNLIRGPISGKFELAEDVTWVVIRKLEKSREKKGWRPEKGPLSGWLYRLIRNQVSGHLRVKGNQHRPCSDFCFENEDGKYGTIEQSLVDHRSPTPQALALKAEQLERAKRLLEQLPPITQRVISLYYEQDLTYREIADEIGSNPTSVFRQVAAVRAKFARLSAISRIAA